jgi:diaminopimelate epimerase
VLLVEPPLGAGADFRMRYYNADGREAESCGNGARCIARYAHSIGAAPASLAFETEAGLYRASMTDEGVILSMSDPHSLRLGVPVAIEGVPGGKVDFINTGVPHVVIFVEDLERAPVETLGRAIRRHPAFAPAGTNVNFARALGGDRVAIRTYERGVEAETLACGTGSVASALIAHLHGLADPPVSIQTSGGPILRIHFTPPADPASGLFSGVKLEGEARVVYQGTLAPEPAAAGGR